VRPVVLKMSISLDGFVCGPNGEIDWIFRTTGGDSTENDGTQVDRTTRALADAKKDGIGKGLHNAPSTAVLQSWADPTVARGDLAEEVARLKKQPGNFILAHGGARFAQSLVASGVIDEYRLVIHPVALGQGQPLFSGLRSPVDLRLVSATPFGSGVVGAVYKAA
jgi:riboflavin biosynthesis pyrimidine reductase